MASALENVMESNTRAYTVVNVPVKRLSSIPPKVSCPLASLNEVVGANEMPTTLLSMRPAVNALSVTVATVPPPLVVPVHDVSQNKVHREHQSTRCEIGWPNTRE